MSYFSSVFYFSVFYKNSIVNDSKVTMNVFFIPYILLEKSG